MRKIIHCDADCFFAAVEMRDDPRLRHIPLAIGGKPDQRGVISTCNYEARRFGVHSAMASWQALRLCPGLTLLPHNMEKYRAASKAMGAIFRDYTDRVEMVSVDEAYLDVSNSPYLSGSATLIAREIRARVKSEVGITVSAGVATNKFLAKIASEWHKPDGLFIIQPGQERAFAADLAVKHLRGVGKVTAARLNSLGIETCKDLYSWPLADLLPHFGAFAPRLKELSLGQDNREIVAQRVRKSLSVEHTFVADLGSKTACLAQIPWLFSELKVRLGRLPKSHPIRKIQVKLKFSNFSQTTLERPCTTLALENFAELIAEGTKRQPLPVRLLGVGVQFDFEALALQAIQLPLFPPSSTQAQ